MFLSAIKKCFLQRKRCWLAGAMSLFVCSTSLLISVQAEEEPSRLPHLSREEKLAAEFSPEEQQREQRLKLLHRFLELPPERLHDIRRSIEQIEKMTPEEKEQMRKRIDEYKKLHPQKRSQLYRHWKKIPSQERTRIRQHWREMSEEERAAERQKLQQMTLDERLEYYRKSLSKPDNKETSSESFDTSNNSSKDEEIPLESNGKTGAHSRHSFSHVRVYALLCRR